jgi:hypothetical protein
VAGRRAEGHRAVPVLVLTGEQGSAKSTLARLVRLLVDPNVSPLRCEPREARDLMIAACNAWVVCLDNISVLWGWLSDALCRLSTGGGFATRTLYSNDEETFLDAMRPIAVTGITDFVNRGDLIDRSMFLHLSVISEEKRRPEREFWGEFDSAAPGLFGALLDAVAGGLRRLPEVKLTALPRMADFAVLAEAVCQALGHPPGKFLEIYNDNRKSANESALADSPLASAVMELVAGELSWSGTAGELLEKLRAILDAQAGRSSGATRQNQMLLPKSPGALSAALKRLAPLFRQAGIQILISRTKKSRVITVQQAEPENGADGSSSSSPASPPDASDGEATTSGVTHENGVATADRHPSSPERHRDVGSSPDRQPSSPERHPSVDSQPFANKGVASSGDAGDAGDAPVPTLSGGGRVVRF